MEVTSFGRSVNSLGKSQSNLWIMLPKPHHQDLKSGVGFQSGAAGEFMHCCREAGLSFGNSYKTHLINHYPKWDQFSQFLVTRTFLKREKIPPEDWPLLGPINKTKYLHPALRPELENLLGLIRKESPNLILGLGAEVCAWLTGEQSIENTRGFIAPMKLLPDQKILCSYHPSSILAQWSNRPILIADLMKAKRESSHAEIKTPLRTILQPETPGDIARFIHDCPVDTTWSVDIETFPSLRLIRSIGLAPNPHVAITIPFVDLDSPDGSYWKSSADEIEAWRLVKGVLEGPQNKIFQNGIYDIQWLYEEARISTRNFSCDTLINHHILYPEMKKSLAFQASLYCDEKIWKGMVDYKAGEGKQDG